jgi:excisionase family DNA binding protein
MMERPTYLTVNEIAEELRVKPRTVRQWLDSGALHGIKAGRQWRVRPENLEAFIEQSAQRPVLVPSDEEER